MGASLVVLDLDDTLIDTFGCLRGRKLKDALQILSDHGLRVGAPEIAFQRLLQIDDTSPSIPETLKRFIDEYRGEASLLSAAAKEYYGNLAPDISVSALPGANDLLQSLQNSHRLALVSIGCAEHQLEKARRAQLNLSCFEFVEFVCTTNKKETYVNLLNRAGMQPSETIVCGDKIEVDLVPAKELGCTTIWLQHGRANRQERSSAVDYAVQTLAELESAIRRISR